MFWKRKNKTGFLRSIRVRLVLGYTCILFAGIIAVSIYFSFQTKARLVEVTRQYLISEIKAAIGLIGSEDEGRIGISNFLSKHTRGIKGSHKIGYALFDSKGLIIASSEGFMEDSKPVESIRRLYGKEKEFPLVLSKSRSPGNTTVYLATQAFLDKGGKVFYLQFGVIPFGHQETVNVFLKTGVLMIPLIILVGFISGVILTGQFLSPISKLIKASEEIVHSDVIQELPVRGTGDELDRLAYAFNNVLKKLRESYQRIMVFTADASHEIRLPITAIKGEAEVMIERGGDVREYKEIMENIVIEMDRLTRIINRMLYLSRGDSRLDKLDLKEIELKSLLSKMVDFYHVLAEKKNISLFLLTQDGSFYLKGDSSKLEDLFSNLIENAIRYTPENGSITLEITEGQGGYAVKVADTGVGIPKEEQEKVFERFYRVDKARSREYGGAGLGLSIAAMIVKAHKGRIQLDSQPQKGSIFTVFLPRG